MLSTQHGLSSCDLIREDVGDYNCKTGHKRGREAAFLFRWAGDGKIGNQLILVKVCFNICFLFLDLD